MKKVFGFLLLSVIAAGCSGGGDTLSGVASNEPITLAINVKPGDSWTYVMNIVAQTGTLTQNVTMEMNSKVISAEPNKFVFENGTGDMTIDGKAPAPEVLVVLQKMKVFVTLDSKGKAISTRLEGAPPGTPIDSGQQSVPFPDHPIKPGDSWEGETSLRGEKVKGKYKFVAVEEVSGKRAAKIEAAIETSQIAMDKPMLFWIDIASGMAVKMEMSGTETASKNKIALTMSVK